METTEQIVLEKVYVPQYIDKALNPELWLSNSEQLIKTANEFEKDLDILWGPPADYTKRNKSQPSLGFIQGIYFMLIAYAIENICKAAIIETNKPKLESQIIKKKKLPKLLNTHNLVKLVRDKLGINISVDDEELLLRLERNAVWASRYPVPLSCEDINANKKLSNGQILFLSYFHRDDITRIKQLFNKIETYVKRLMKKNNTLQGVGD